MSANDLEHGPSSEPELASRVPVVAANDVIAIQLTLQELQTDLGRFLAAHTEKVISLQVALAPTDLHPSVTTPVCIRPTKDSNTLHAEPPATAVNAFKPERQSVHPSTDSSRVSLLGSAQSNVVQAVDLHTRNLESFLQFHVQNIRLLHNALQRNASHKPADSVAAHNGTSYPLQPVAHFTLLLAAKPELDNTKLYESLTDQFNMLVVISTFTASLIVSYVSLAKTIVNSNHRVASDVGMLLSFFAMNVHFGNIIVAGRGAALTSQHSGAEDDHHDLKYFRHYLEICEQLQFFATLMFIIAITVFTFLIFSEIVFPFTLLGASICGGVIVFWSAYWRVSITFRNMKFLIKSMRRLGAKSRAYFA